MKRKAVTVIALTGILVIIAAVFSFIYFTPRPVLRNPETAKLQNIRHHGAVESITLDANQVKGIVG